MARRKTFTHLRVRGKLEVDNLLVHKSLTQTAGRIYQATLAYDTNAGALTVTETLNQFGSLNWIHPATGIWTASFNQNLPWDKFHASAIPPFWDGDGILFLPVLHFGYSSPSFNTLATLSLRKFDGTDADPFDFLVPVHFVLYK